MMIKALLAWAGVMATRAPIHRSKHPANPDVHEAVNREQAIFAGAQAVVRQSHTLSDVMASDPTNTHRVNKGLTDMRSTIAETARRAYR